MHTAQLKKDYPEVYREFFNKYDLVVSATMIDYLWWVNFSFSHGKTASMYNKFPLRIYCGINPWVKSDRIEYIYKMNSESNFEKGSIIDHYNITSSLLKKIGINGEVGFLAEYHWHDAPCLSSAVTVAKMLLDEEIEVSDVMKFDISRDYHGVLKSALMWDSVHRTYGFLDKMRNTSSWLTPCLLAADSHMLVIDQQAGVKVFDMGKNLTYDNLNYSVHILCPNVYSKSFMQSGDFVEINNEVRSFALDQGIDLPDPDYIDSMDIAGFHLAVETYQKLGYLYRWDARGESFFDLMSFIDKINCFVNRDSLERSLDMDFSSIIGSFQKNKDARWYVEQDFGRIIVYGDRSIKITSTIIEQINQWLDYHLTLDYSSHSDGFERGWVRVEQYRSKWFVQEFSKSPMDYGIKKQNRK